MVLLFVAPGIYPYALMGLAANFFFCQILGPIVGLPARRGAFTSEFLKSFNEVHKATYGENRSVDGLGQPDQGSGWYSK